MYVERSPAPDESPGYCVPHCGVLFLSVEDWAGLREEQEVSSASGAHHLVKKLGHAHSII